MVLLERQGASLRFIMVERHIASLDQLLIISSSAEREEAVSCLSEVREMLQQRVESPAK